jgi:transglutaminase-like putative cysteine protease
MNRRRFLQVAGAAAAAVSIPRRTWSITAEPGWRRFDVTTHVEVSKPTGTTRVWVPLPLAADTDFQKGLGNEWSAPGGSAKLARAERYGVTMVAAEWPAGVPAVLDVTSRVATRDRAVDLATRPAGASLDPAERKLYLAPARLVPTDGIVAETARTIVASVKGGDVERARALYDWVVDTTYRDPNVKGCGVGDIRSMLETKTMGGKCADINGLFVGLARAAGIPARDLYGIRVEDSRRGYKALGKHGDVTKGQHCRCEFFAEGRGWIPVDAGDVRKVILEEPPGNLAAADPKVTAARQLLFGAWEMNWMAYNYGHDVALPGAAHGDVGFLMYPQGETGAGRIDCLDAAAFSYQIHAREMT